MTFNRGPGTSEEHARWQGWLRAHQQALDALRAAAQEYHRLIVDQAFAVPDGEARRRRHEAPGRLEERKRRLDELREQQPKCPL